MEGPETILRDNRPVRDTSKRQSPKIIDMVAWTFASVELPIFDCPAGKAADSKVFSVQSFRPLSDRKPKE